MISALVCQSAHLLSMDNSRKPALGFLTQIEVARLLGVPERTLEGWRLTMSGPLWLPLGRHGMFSDAGRRWSHLA